MLKKLFPLVFQHQLSCNDGGYLAIIAAGHLQEPFQLQKRLTVYHKTDLTDLKLS